MAKLLPPLGEMGIRCNDKNVLIPNFSFKSGGMGRYDFDHSKTYLLGNMANRIFPGSGRQKWD